MIPDPLLNLLREVISREDCPPPYRHAIAEYLATGNDYVLSQRNRTLTFGHSVSQEMSNGPWGDFADAVYMNAPGTTHPHYMLMDYTEDQATHARTLLPPIPPNESPA